jgi:glutaredoxin
LPEACAPCRPPSGKLLPLFIFEDTQRADQSPKNWPRPTHYFHRLHHSATAIKRSAEAQAVVNQAAASLSLYQFRACPFCVRTRRVIRQLNLPIALLDAMNDAVARETLLAEGGAIKVPCLRIDDNGSVTWMYESKVIIAYLQQRFA